MAQVEVTINGRGYLVACDDGQENHVARLGQYLDQKVSVLVKSVGQVGDARLLLMAGLLVADELSERSGVPAAPAAAALNGAGIDEAALADTLNGLAERIEAIVVALEQD
ncbi:MAG TPA: cell division protein ZapA [Aliidongia sp.]|nr:cell division protein ZapA [Aliidongia sp.]